MAKLNFIGIIISMVTISTSQQLKVEYSSAKLGSGDFCHRLHYDGNDTVYIFDGCADFQNVQKYSIETDQISQLTTLPEIFYFGSLQADMDGNVFLFGAGYDNDAIIKYDVASDLATIAATLPFTIYYNPTANCDSGNSSIVHILGGTYSPNLFKILTFDMETNEIEESSSTLPIDLAYSTSICVDDRVFVFSLGGNVSEFNSTSGELEVIGQYEKLGDLRRFPSLATDGSSIYIIPAFGSNKGEGYAGILKFEPIHHSISFLPVENWPVKDGERYFDVPPQSVFIPKLNRIYGFGGLSRNMEDGDVRTHDEIFYIDLSPELPTTLSPTVETSTDFISTTTMNPDFFSCFNRTKDFYPHPTDCSLFIQCADEEIVQLFCPPPLLFNPIWKLCDFPEAVECGTSCISKADGFHPHPHDCALYIFCRDEVATFYKCPSGYYYDPIIQACNLPNAVICNSNF